jgi:tRNA pseudouridine55 synthase
MRSSRRRPEQVAETLRQVIAEGLAREVRDRRVGFVTVTGVLVTPDLSHARPRRPHQRAARGPQAGGAQLIGAVLVDKPAGLTSHDVVQRVRRVLGTRAVGHTGTLDPFATGLLVALVGRATRLARFVEAQPKRYLATARLGVATDTDDPTGAALGDPADVTQLDEATVRGALAGFLGAQTQRPPRYSAKHVGGERSYRLARRGVGADPAATTVTISQVELVRFAPPEVTFRVTVSPGTYVRAIARDLGERLGVGAHLTALRREAIGGLSVADAVPLERLTREALLPVRAVLRHLPAIELDEPERVAVSHGRPLPAVGRPEGHVALLHAGEVVAVARGGDGWLRPAVVLGTP